MSKKSEDISRYVESTFQLIGRFEDFMNSKVIPLLEHKY